MTDNIVEQIKEKINLVDLIGEYVPLKKVGANHKGLCPFHHEKTPSFMVSEEKQIWHCFGCSKGGDVFTFLQEREGVDFKEALKILAERTGVVLKRENPRVLARRERLWRLLEITTKFYAKALYESRSGATARVYLKKRGVGAFATDLFKLGFAPDSFQILGEFLKKKGFKEEEISAAGLTAPKKTGGYYDRFRYRLIFPLFDLHGRVCGFAGRVLRDEALPKYLNSPETEIYHKGRMLYGLNLAKSEVRRRDFVILVEGYLDLIASHEAGVTNIVASSGTALTLEQINLVKRFTKNLYLCFDMDLAGQSATRRGVELALAEGLNVKIITLLSGKDPDELIREEPKAWQKAIKEAKPLYEHYFTQAFEKFDPSSLNSKKKAFALLLPLIAKIPDKLEQSHYVQRLAAKTGVEETVVYEALRKTSNSHFRVKSSEDKKFVQSNSAPSKEKNALKATAEHILGLWLAFPELIGENFGVKFSNYLARNESRLAKKIYDLYNMSSVKLKSGQIQKHLARENAGLEILAKRLTLSLENDLPGILDGEVGPEVAKKDLKQSLDRLKKHRLRRKLRLLSETMREAENRQQEKRVLEISQEFTALTAELLNCD